MRSDVFEDVVTIVNEFSDEFWFEKKDTLQLETRVVDIDHIMMIRMEVSGYSADLDADQLISAEKALKIVKALKKAKKNYHVESEEGGYLRFEGSEMRGRLLTGKPYVDMPKEPPVEAYRHTSSVRVIFAGNLPIVKKGLRAKLSFKKCGGDGMCALPKAVIEDNSRKEIGTVDLSAVTYMSDADIDIRLSIRDKRRNPFNAIGRIVKVIGSLEGTLYPEQVHILSGHKDYDDGSRLSVEVFIAPTIVD